METTEKTPATRELRIEVPAGKKAAWVDGALRLVDEDVTDRVKTVRDARRELGADNPLVEALDLYEAQLEGEVCGMDDIGAYLELRVVAAALNGDWRDERVPGREETLYHPYFHIENGRAMPGAGVRAECGTASEPAHIAFKNERLAYYAIRQFRYLFLTLMSLQDSPGGDE